MKKLKRLEPREQLALERVKNFDEVCYGFKEDQAVEEASRCLQCKVPMCVQGCPVNVSIPNFIKLIREGKFENALKTIKENNNLPAVCGRVCPQERQCESKCVLGKKGEAINIGKLERFASEYDVTPKKKIVKKGEKVAIVGSGPAGLSCAADLANMGYNVTIFEALHKPGGVLTYGIPEFRLPKDIVMREVDNILNLGVEIKLNYLVGKCIDIQELLKEYKAVFIGTGAGLPTFMEIPGEHLNNVYSANEFLTRVNLMKAHMENSTTPVYMGKKVVVVGGGNVAMDSARTAKRLGANVTILYRRTEKEMPARLEEVNHAKQEGIKFMMLTSPVKILGTQKVEGVKCVQMMLSAPDASGRRKPVPMEGSEFNIEADQVIIAIGQGSNPLLVKSAKIQHNSDGDIIVDDSLMTSIEGVFAGGDIIGGEGTVIQAMGHGKKAAKAIDSYIKRNSFV